MMTVALSGPACLFHFSRGGQDIIILGDMHDSKEGGCPAGEGRTVSDFIRSLGDVTIVMETAPFFEPKATPDRRDMIEDVYKSFHRSKRLVHADARLHPNNYMLRSIGHLLKTGKFDEAASLVRELKDLEKHALRLADPMNAALKKFWKAEAADIGSDYSATRAQFLRDRSGANELYAQVFAFQTLVMDVYALKRILAAPTKYVVCVVGAGHAYACARYLAEFDTALLVGQSLLKKRGARDYRCITKLVQTR
jgi:hypothetical protein